MKKKTTKKKTTTGARKAKVHDLSARKRAAAAAKGGASVVSSASGVSGIVAQRTISKLDVVLDRGPRSTEVSRSPAGAAGPAPEQSRDGEFSLSLDFWRRFRRQYWDAKGVVLRQALARPLSPLPRPSRDW